MTDLTEEPKKTDENRNPDGTFAQGNPGGPGRPKGKTIKERVKEWLDEHPEDMEKFVEYFVKENRDLAWQMMEGRPAQGIGQADDLDKLIVKIVNYTDEDNGNTNS